LGEIVEEIKFSLDVGLYLDYRVLFASFTSGVETLKRACCVSFGAFRGFWNFLVSLFVVEKKKTFYQDPK